MSARLTEKKLADVRFRKTEEAIFEAFFDKGDGARLSVNELIQKIGVDRTTFYRHHRTINDITEDYEQYIVEKYAELIKTMRNRNEMRLKRVYYETMLFILQNRKVFEALTKVKNSRVLEDMMWTIEVEIINFLRLPSNSELVLRVYVGEIVGLIMDWGLTGFKEVEMVGLLNNIMYMTETVRERLLPLVY